MARHGLLIASLLSSVRQRGSKMGGDKAKWRCDACGRCRVTDRDDEHSNLGAFRLSRAGRVSRPFGQFGKRSGHHFSHRPAGGLHRAFADPDIGSIFAKGVSAMLKSLPRNFIRPCGKRRKESFGGSSSDSGRDHTKLSALAVWPLLARPISRFRQRGMASPGTETSATTGLARGRVIEATRLTGPLRRLPPRRPKFKVRST
jgi:hypothetical protein